MADDFDAWLRDTVKLPEHAEQLHALGYDDLEFLAELEKDEIAEMKAALTGAGFAPGHAMKFIKAVNKLSGGTGTGTGMSSGSGAGTDPAGAQAAAMDGSTVQAGFIAAPPPAPMGQGSAPPAYDPAATVQPGFVMAGGGMGSPSGAGGDMGSTMLAGPGAAMASLRFCAVCNSDVAGDEHCDAPTLDLAAAARTQPHVGLLVARKFKIITDIQSGGMGEVWLAKDTSIDRQVALKTVRMDLGGGTAMLKMLLCRFKREAIIGARLDHPNLIKVHEFGQDANGVIYMALSLVEGRSLDRVIRDQGPMNTQELVWTIGLALDGLHAFHQSGALHRDIKPSNIMLCGEIFDGQIKVIDYGISKRVATGDIELVDDDDGVTSDGGAPASLPYEAPERLSDDSQTDLRADLFSMAVSAYELALGKRPFTASHPGALIAALLTTPFPAGPLAEATTPEVAAVIKQAGAKQPDQRYATAREMADALRAAAPGRDEAADEQAAAAAAAVAAADAEAAARREEMEREIAEMRARAQEETDRLRREAAAALAEAESQKASATASAEQSSSDVAAAQAELERVRRDAEAEAARLQAAAEAAAAELQEAEARHRAELAKNTKMSPFERACLGEKAIVAESEHPYADNCEIWGNVEIPGAQAIALIFSPETCTEVHHDYLRIYREDPRNGSNAGTWGPDRVSGRTGSWPGQASNPPLVVQADHFTWCFKSDGSSNDWGFKFVAYKTEYHDPLEQWIAKPGAVVKESQHPYSENLQQREEVVIEGARHIFIYFDPSSSTEQHCDFLSFHRDASYSSTYGEQKYHGGFSGSQKNFPGSDGREPLIIAGDRFFMSFVSDASNNDWGFRFVAYADNEYVDPWDAFKAEHPGGMEFESEHPYSNSFHGYWGPLGVAGASMLAVVFHPDSQTEAQCDMLSFYLEDPRPDGNGSAPPRGNVKQLSNPLSGRPNFPHSLGHQDPCLLNGNNVWAYLRTDDSNVDWGFKAYVYAVEDPMSGFCGDFGLEVASEHPYDNSLQQSWPVCIPGASTLEIAFSPQSSTEASYDYVQFWSEDGSTRFGEEKYSGGRGGSAKNFPTREAPLVIPGDRCKITFRTDDSNNDWGFRCCIRPSTSDSAENLRAAAQRRREELARSNLYEHHRNTAGAVLRESAHPYLDNTDEWEEIRIPGAAALAVVFSQETRTEHHHDFVRFVKCDRPTSESTWGPARNSGAQGAWPGQAGNQPIFIPGDRVVFNWHTDGSNVEWGFQMCIYPVDSYPDPAAELIAKPGAMVFESAHPYANSMDKGQDVVIPGSRYLMVAFSPDSCTETNCDKVTFYRDSSRSAKFGDDYSGGRGGSGSNWPGVAGRPPLAIPGDRFHLFFHSDGSNVDWGYKCIVWPDNDYTDPWDEFKAENPGGVEVESPHPYVDNMDVTYPVQLGGGHTRMCIVFHPDSRTEAGCDFVTVYASDPRSGNATAVSRNLSGSPGFPHRFGTEKGLVFTSASDTAYLQFHTDSSNVDWGFKAYVYPAADPLHAWAGISNFSRFVESAHPYADNTNQSWPIGIPGASKLEIAFDPESSTEASYDYIQFSDRDGATRFGEEKYSGGRGGGAKNFPTPESPLIVNADFVLARFVTDNSNTDWGVRFAVRPVGTSDADLERAATELTSSPSNMTFDTACMSPACQVVESAHQYANNTHEHGSISIPGASAIGIIFSPETATERTHDYLRFYLEDPSKNSSAAVEGAERYSGPVGGWPGHGDNPPLVLRGSQVWYTWHTDGSNVDWGFKFAAFKTVWVDPMAEWLAMPGAIVLEGPHPYTDNMDTHQSISIPGAKNISVVFDPRTSTEATHDFVRFHRDNSHDAFYGKEKYHGGRGGSTKNWPGFGGRLPLTFPGSSAVLSFHSDQSNVCWGWRCVAFRNDDYVDPWTQMLKDTPNGVMLETPHPYSDNLDLYQHLQLPGAEAIQIVFHEDSRTEAGCDHLRFYASDPRQNSDAPVVAGPLSGRPTFPHTYGETDPLLLRGNDFWLHFHTDGSNVDWGYKLFATPAADPMSAFNGRFVQWVESEHPYENNLNQVFPVYIAGAQYLEIAFDPQSTTELNYDFISFWSRDEQTRYGNEKYSGGRGGTARNFAGATNPVRVEGNFVIVKFHTDGSNVDWGFRLAVRPGGASDAELQAAAEADPLGSWTSPHIRWIESSHPYANNADDAYEVFIPGASQLQIAFDAASSTETNYDFLSFFTRGNNRVGEEKYSGGRGGSAKNFPGAASPLVVDGDYVLIKFHSDGSNDDWGFRLAVNPVGASDAQLSAAAERAPMGLWSSDPFAVFFESPHPYLDNTNQQIPVRIPGAASLRIAFDAQSATEAGYDHVSFWSRDGATRFGAEKYSGGRGGTAKNFPTAQTPLDIPGDSCIIKFITDNSNTDWGWKIGVRPGPTSDPSALATAAASVTAGEWGVASERVLESAHPYPDNANDSTVVHLPGANGLELFFDPQTSLETNYDYVSIWSRDGTTRYGLEKYTGGRGGTSKNFPMAGTPLRIPDVDACTVKFVSDNSNNDWGYKLTVRAAGAGGAAAVDLSNIRADSCDALAALGTARWVESSHPYSDNSNESTPVSFPGCSAIAVAFVPESSTEANYDYVVFKGRSDEVLGQPKYSGGRGGSTKTFPTPQAPLVIQGDYVKLCFISDASNTDWGFRCVLVGIGGAPGIEAWAAGGQVIESAHPYADNTNTSWTVHLPGSGSLAIAFDPQSSTETNYDYISFHNSDESRQYGLAKYSGGRGGSSKNYPTTAAPLTIPGDFVKIKFVSDGSNNDWGFKLAVKPGGAVQTLDTWGAGGSIIESAHPYADNTNTSWTAHVPGASSLLIAFDPQSSTERSYDYVQFFNSDETTRFGDEKYSGGRGGSASNWPTTAAPLTIPGDFVKVKFVTDNSNTDWGFRMCVKSGAAGGGATPAAPAQQSLQTWAPAGSIVESAHPYADNTNTSWVINSAGASQIEIAFDPQSSTETNYDYVQFVNQAENQIYGLEKYCGGRGGSSKNFPTTSNPLVIPGDYVKVKFISDGSNNDWGFRLIAKATGGGGGESIDSWAGGSAGWVESEHEYGNSLDQSWDVRLAGASNMEIAFDPRTSTESSYDYVSFTLESGERVGEEKYSGGRGGSSKNFPTPSNPLRVPSDFVRVRFVTDNSNTDWGFRLAVRPAQGGPAVLPYSQASAQPGAVIAESSHPYSDNENYRREVTIPGANFIKIVFDPTTATESSYDYVTFYKGGTDQRWGQPKYSGGRGGSTRLFPGLDGQPALVVHGNSFQYTFISDGSNNDWGWRFAAYADNSYVDPMAAWAGASSIESEHPYADNANQEWNLNGDSSCSRMLVCFDPQTSTEASYDFVSFWSQDDSQRYGEEKYSGGRGGSASNWPTAENPLVIPNNRFKVKFQSDNSNNDWGFKMYVRSG